MRWVITFAILAVMALFAGGCDVVSHHHVHRGGPVYVAPPPPVVHYRHYSPRPRYSPPPTYHRHRRW